MKQTNSAISMLIHAYRSILTHCFNTKNLVGSEMESRAMIKDR